jgi:two-component system alkaline phosphatase synthesis response regulator PhoP
MDATILVIEESLDLCRLFEYMLRADGYTVRAFHDWQAAQAALSLGEPDLVIFDWSLANIAGYAWARALRSDPATAHIPVLFVCGDSPTRGDMEIIGSVGISVIDKPFDIFMFRKRVTALLAPRERAAGIRYA